MPPKKNGNQNIKVAVRCRPLNNIEKRAGSYDVVKPIPEKREVHVREKLGIVTQMKTFGFDHVFAPTAKQIDIYKSVVVPVVDEVLLGYNCTIFAYGQTGTGKTFTMEGERSPDQHISWEEDPLAGIIPRTMHHIFEQLKKQDVEFSVRVSFIELYNEELFDLLGSSTSLRIFEDPKKPGSIIIHGMEEITVNNKDEIYQILERGAARRQTAATLMNATSSRSHSVFSVTIHTKDTTITGEELLKTGKLYLVDLAGSENIGRSGAVDKRAREAGNINQSLLTLGRVITALVEHAPHVPYRESKLTRLLQDSLGGKTKTSIIATISPAACNLEETLSTLDYAHRAKNIQNRPEINQKLTKKALLKEYTNEIEALKKDLAAARDKNGVYLAEDNYNMMTEKLQEQEAAIKEMEDQITALIEEKEKIQELFVKTDKQLEQTTETLTQTKSQLVETKENLKEKAIECDEQKFLVNEHVKTEKVLFTQAEQLLSTANESTSDVDGLHAKLGRKQIVEIKNESLSTQFKEKFQKSVLGMHQLTDVMLVTMSKFHTDNSAQLNLLLEVLKTHSGSMLKSQLDMVEAVKKHTSQMEKEKCKERSATVKWLEETKNTVEESVKLGIDHSSAINTELITGLQAQMEGFQLIQTLMSQLKMQLEKQKSDQEKRVKAMAECLRNQLSSHSSLVKTHVAWQEEQIKELQQSVEESSFCNKDIEQHLSQAMESIKLAQSKRENSSALNEKLHKLVTAQKEVTLFDDLQRNLTATQNYVTEQTDMELTHAVEKYDTYVGHIEKVENEVKEVEEKNSSIKANFVGHFAKVKQNWEDCSSNLDEKLDFYQTETNTSMNVFVNQNENFVQSSTSVLEHAQSDAEEDQKKIGSQLGDLMQLSKSHFDSVSEKTEVLKSGLTAREEEVENLLTKEIAKDISTGCTPKPREFSYPTDLNRTELHDVLLSQYRENMKNLNELEECEMTVVTESPPDSMKSEVGSDNDTNDQLADISFSSEISDTSKSSETKENRSQMPPPLSAKKLKHVRSRSNSNSSRSRVPLRTSNNC